MSFFTCGGHTCATVKWYGPPTMDEETALLVYDQASRDTNISAVVKLEDLSEPLIVAVENTKVHVLDFMDRRRCLELLNWIES